jgi:hypothetical protein
MAGQKGRTMMRGALAQACLEVYAIVAAMSISPRFGLWSLPGHGQTGSNPTCLVGRLTFHVRTSTDFGGLPVYQDLIQLEAASTRPPQSSQSVREA